ncbi:Mediator of replication checkpoint protein 1 [Tolypocladium capitatum]|uniref:Mediator of replication checkpoint protein 1 n=1 Tax=Tolypocladium capitatum TaxID=45235 RepID=A0A2K3QHA2_9HYPO|nr:Mediator of replication checkpoint protein 1 [Tolypocladium capitatum]
MASSRALSPASSGGTPEPLTPRSKIRALLATVESSDDEDGPSAPRTNTDAGVVTPKGTDQQTRDDDESDESDVAIRPRGKLASRMQGATKEAEMTAAPKTARERVREMLAREEAEAEAEQTRAGDVGDVEDEDDGLPVAPRRLQRRAPRAPAPGDAEPSARSQSPGLFVSSPMRPSPTKSVDTNPESDNDLPAIKSDRFKALVERKRQERLAREAAEEARKAEREKLASELEQLVSDDGDDSGITDDEGGRRLTQKARPTRKASKKAVEEMNRETQRMARNMQLAHEARTRRKISTASLFERFNYKPATGLAPDPKTHSSSRPTTPQTDAEMKDADTPPSSPPTTKGQDLPAVVHNADVMGKGDDEGPPSWDGAMNTAADKGKGKAPAIDLDKMNEATRKPKRRVRVRLPVAAANVATLGSDDELEITRPTKDKISAMFDNIPAQQGKGLRSLKALQALALVKSPGKDSRHKSGRPHMTAGELHAQLHQKAKQQAKVERERRLEMLKAQGIVVQTADERERQEQEVEDLVAKAREEAHQIMQLERAAAKKSRMETGEADPLAWDDSDDEEYEDSTNEADVEASAVELSGSEDEEGVEDDDVEEGFSNPPVDEDAESEASEVDEAREEDEDVDELPVVKQRRARNQTAVLSDDEAEVQATPRPVRTTTQMTPAAPTPVLRSARKTFIPGLPVHGPAGLGLTQIFAGTMDDGQMSPLGAPTQSMMPDIDFFPDSNFSASMDEPAEDMVTDSQREETQNATQGVELNLSQSQMHGFDSLLPDVFQTQMSQTIEPSQDTGFQQHSPLKERFLEPPLSTVETLAADQEDDEPHESPLVRRGRLRRKMQMPIVEEESTQATPTADDAFNVMADGARREKRKRLMDEFDRKKTKAKEMVEEQAQESDDEYAGLGGADGEDSDNESAASLKEIIDDAAGNDMDEGELAAFYADRQRANDEKEVEKLFKDIATGMLRRKRGTDYDLSDSDDGGEARRRMKRRQFAKMQKALFSDERVKKMAENPGNQAFLRTIEDRGSDDEMDLLDVMDTQEQAESQSQSQSQAGGCAAQRRQQQTIPDSQPAKQPSGVSVENRAPAHMRRTKGAHRPSNIGIVRETLSSLLEERQGSVIPATEAGSESEEGDEHQASPRSDKENQVPNPRRGSTAVVDRIGLKRNASSTLSKSSARLAFAAAAQTAGSFPFKVPALLRRATTNSTLTSGSSTSSGGAAGSAGGFGEDAKIKRGAGKRSGVGGFAREGEAPRAEMRDSERRREAKKVKGAARRVGVVRGLLGKGSFE